MHKPLLSSQYSAPDRQALIPGQFRPSSYTLITWSSFLDNVVNRNICKDTVLVLARQDEAKEAASYWLE